MLNLTLLSTLTVLPASATATPIADTTQTPPPAIAQLAQEPPRKPNVKDRECNWRGAISFFNGCNRNLHVWRQDSSVD